jgi:hypothetical protein
MGGDGGETKQCTLDVIHTDRGHALNRPCDSHTAPLKPLVAGCGTHNVHLLSGTCWDSDLRFKPTTTCKLPKKLASKSLSNLQSAEQNNPIYGFESSTD